MTSNSTTPDSPKQETCPRCGHTNKVGDYLPDVYCGFHQCGCRHPFHTSLPTGEQCSSCGDIITSREEYQVYFGKDGVRLACHTNQCPQHLDSGKVVMPSEGATENPQSTNRENSVVTGAAHPSETRAGEQEGSTMEPEIKPHSSVLYTDLTVRCHGCKSALVWRYLEDIDEIEVFHEHGAAPVQTGEGSTMRSGKMLDRMEQDLAAQSEGVAPNRQTWQSMSSDEQLSFLAAQTAEIAELNKELLHQKGRIQQEYRICELVREDLKGARERSEGLAAQLKAAQQELTAYQLTALSAMEIEPMQGSPSAEQLAEWIETLVVEQGNFKVCLKELQQARQDCAKAESDLRSTKENSGQLQVQLAGCMTAACGATKDPATEGMYGWSPAYQSVLKLRLQFEAAETLVGELRTTLSEAVGRKTITHLVDCGCWICRAEELLTRTLKVKS